MKPHDSALREALINVLTAFDMQYEDVNRNGSPTLAFQIGRVTHRFSYNSATEDTNGSVRKLVNLLRANGYSPVEREEKDRRQVQAKMPFVAAAIDRQPSENSPISDEDEAENPNMSDNIKKDEPAITEAPTSEAPISEAPTAPQNPPPAPEPVEPASVEGIVVYKPRPQHAPAEVYVVEAKQEFVVMAGDRLVIPVHRPDLMMVLSAEEFETRYMPLQFERPYNPTLQVKPSPATVQASPPTASPVVMPPPTVEAPMVPAPVSAPPPVPEATKPAVVRDPPLDAVEKAFIEAKVPVRVVAPVYTTKAPVMPEPKVAVARSAHPPVFPTATPAREPRVEPRPAQAPKLAIVGQRAFYDGVPCSSQLGRILVGIRQALIATGQAEVTSTEAGPYMPPPDRKQISARIHQAVAKGWAIVKGGRSNFLYSLTPVGDRAVAAVAKACYEMSDFAAPPFIETWGATDPVAESKPKREAALA